MADATNQSFEMSKSRRNPSKSLSAMEIPILRILTLNCWGLKYLSKYRSERLSEIGNRLASYSPPLDIVGLQECWTWSDYNTIRDLTRSVLPYGKFYNSGIFGGGLAIFSRFPIEESSMFRYPLNGRPTAFFRGDWYVGKGVACAKLRMPDGQAIEVFNTHLHAPYEREPNDSYICHRTAQAWEISKLMKAAQERGSLVLGLGDFNMIPMSFAYVLVENRGNVKDIWRVKWPDSSVGASIDAPEIGRRKTLSINSTPDVDESLGVHGHTCDSVVNTWRWEEAQRKALEKGHDRKISGSEPDPKAKRLDYIFFGGLDQGWEIDDVQVTLTERHPTLRCSLSDHFAVYACIKKTGAHQQKTTDVQVDSLLQDEQNAEPRTDIAGFKSQDFAKVISKVQTHTNLVADFYSDILTMIHMYTRRERKQRRWRLAHFVGSALFSIGSFVAVWWSTYNYVAFILLFISTMGILAGTLDGLIGGLFVGSELRALSEFEWEVRNAMERAGGPKNIESSLRDWYD